MHAATVPHLEIVRHGERLGGIIMWVAMLGMAGVGEGKKIRRTNNSIFYTPRHPTGSYPAFSENHEKKGQGLSIDPARSSKTPITVIPYTTALPNPHEPQRFFRSAGPKSNFLQDETSTDIAKPKSIPVIFDTTAQLPNPHEPQRFFRSAGTDSLTGKKNEGWNHTPLWACRTRGPTTS